MFKTLDSMTQGMALLNGKIGQTLAMPKGLPVLNKLPWPNVVLPPPHPTIKASTLGMTGGPGQFKLIGYRR